MKITTFVGLVAIGMIVTGTIWFLQSPGGANAPLAPIVLGIGVLSICLYFLPTIIGIKRGINVGVVLFFINLFLGWTLIGWIVCLIWAASGATKAQDAFYSRERVALRDARAAGSREIILTE